MFHARIIVGNWNSGGAPHGCGSSAGSSGWSAKGTVGDTAIVATELHPTVAPYVAQGFSLQRPALAVSWRVEPACFGPLLCCSISENPAHSNLLTRPHHGMNKHKPRSDLQAKAKK